MNPLTIQQIAQLFQHPQIDRAVIAFAEELHLWMVDLRDFRLLFRSLIGPSRIVLYRRISYSKSPLVSSAALLASRALFYPCAPDPDPGL